MIRYKTGDVLAEPAEALVNTVNCVGVMGRGVAPAIQACISRQLQGVRSPLQA